MPQLQALDLSAMIMWTIGGNMLDTSKLLAAVGAETEPDETIVERLRFDDFDVPIELTDAQMWANYVNDDLYELDKKVREFLKKTRYARSKGGYKTTASLVFAWIYGRKPEASDGAACRMLHELLKYYSSKYTSGPTTFQGKKVTRVYTFSRYSCDKRRPYSLRLRLEESDAGANPWRKSPIDDSKKRSVGRRKHSEVG